MKRFSYLLTLSSLLAASPALAEEVPAAPAPTPTIGTLKVEGLHSVGTALVLRELSETSGTALNQALLAGDRDRLMRTNLFTKLDPVLDAAKDHGPTTLTWQASENTPTTLTGFSVGYNATMGFSLGLGLANWNLFNAGHQGAFSFAVGPASNVTGELAYLAPWLDAQGSQLGASVYSRRNYNYTGNFREDRAGARLFGSRPILGDAHSPLALRASAELDRINTFVNLATGGAPVPAYQDGRPVTLSPDAQDVDVGLGLGVVYDTRTPLSGDDRFNQPKDGWLNSLLAEPLLIGGTHPLVKLTAGLTRFIPMPGLPWSSEPATLLIAGRAGSVLGPAVPAYKKFYSDGYYFDAPVWSVTGYEREMPPFMIRGTTFYPILSPSEYVQPRTLYTGTNAVVATLEYRFPIYRVLSGVLFADYGGFWDDHFDSGLMHAGLGPGLRIATGLGVLRLDYGMSAQFPGVFYLGWGERL